MNTASSGLYTLADAHRDIRLVCPRSAGWNVVIKANSHDYEWEDGQLRVRYDVTAWREGFEHATSDYDRSDTLKDAVEDLLRQFPFIPVETPDDLGFWTEACN